MALGIYIHYQKSQLEYFMNTARVRSNILEILCFILTTDLFFCTTLKFSEVDL